MRLEIVGALYKYSYKYHAIRLNPLMPCSLTEKCTSAKVCASAHMACISAHFSANIAKPLCLSKYASPIAVSTMM